MSSSSEDRKAYNASYHEANKERIRAQQREYYRRNKSWILARAKVYEREWRLKNKERLNARRRERYRLNPEHELSVNKKWQLLNKGKAVQYYRNARSKDPDRIRKYCRDSYWRHVEKRREASRKYSWAKGRRRLARLRSVVIDERGIKEWIKSVKAQETATCYYCATVILTSDIEFDHVIPISRQGPHALYNLCVSCMSCNRSKHAKTPSEWPETGQKLLNL